MKVVICIKQVPDTAHVRINPETNTLMREGVPSIINPFDMYALEEGLRLKQQTGGTAIALSMGPPQAAEALRESISLGIDEAILLSDRAFAGSDTLATSYTLAKAIEKIGAVDLIICGKQAIDGDTAQVGPGIADKLDIPFISFVKKIEEVGSKKLRVQRMMDDGYDVVEASLPALITVVKEINIPRLPSLKGKIRAKNYQVAVWGARDLAIEKSRIGLEGSPTKVIKIFHPPSKGNRQMIEGAHNEERVERLISKLKEIKVL